MGPRSGHLSRVNSHCHKEHTHPLLWTKYERVLDFDGRTFYLVDDICSAGWHSAKSLLVPLEHLAFAQSICLGMARDICICSKNFLAIRNALRNHFSWLWSSFFIEQYRAGSWGRMPPTVLEGFCFDLIFYGRSP